MICVLGFYKRKRGITHEQFQNHWKDVHAPLAMSTPEIARYIRRYVQHRLSPVSMFPGVEPLEYDGFSEVWVDSVADFQAMAVEPKFQELMVPDEEKFLDVAATRVIMLDDPQVITASCIRDAAKVDQEGEAL